MDLAMQPSLRFSLLGIMHSWLRIAFNDVTWRRDSNLSVGHRDNTSNLCASSQCVSISFYHSIIHHLHVNVLSIIVPGAPDVLCWSWWHLSSNCTEVLLSYEFWVQLPGRCEKTIGRTSSWYEFYVEATGRNLSLDKITAPCWYNNKMYILHNT